MDSVNILNQLISEHQNWAYLVIALGLIFEGEVVLLATGILAKLGALNFYTSLIFILTGSMFKTFGCYYLGMLLQKKSDKVKFLQYMNKKILCIMPHFLERPFWSIFISKFIMGINYFTLIFSGYNKVKFATYFKAELFSTIIWAPGLLYLGYFFGETALSFSKEFWRFSFIIVTMIVSFVFIDKLLANAFTMVKYIRNGFKHDHACVDHCEK